MSSEATWTHEPNADAYRRLLAILFKPDEAEQVPDSDGGEV